METSETKEEPPEKETTDTSEKGINKKRFQEDPSEKQTKEETDVSLDADELSEEDREAVEAFIVDLQKADHLDSQEKREAIETVCNADPRFPGLQRFYICEFRRSLLGEEPPRAKSPEMQMQEAASPSSESDSSSSLSKNTEAAGDKEPQTSDSEIAEEAAPPALEKGRRVTTQKQYISGEVPSAETDSLKKTFASDSVAATPKEKEISAPLPEMLPAAEACKSPSGKEMPFGLAQTIPGRRPGYHCAPSSVPTDGSNSSPTVASHHSSPQHSPNSAPPIPRTTAGRESSQVVAPVNYQVPVSSTRQALPEGSPVSAGTRSSNQWENMVGQAAGLLEERIERLPDQEVSMGQRARLRLLHLVMGNQREAVRPIDTIAPEFQDFWRNEILGLHTLLDEKSIPDQSQRCALAQYHMQEGQAAFAKTCPMEIRNMQLIEIPDHQVVGYGIYEPSRGEYLAGKKAYLYAELENVSTKKLSDGYFTKVGSRYEIIDANGNSVVKHDCNVCEDLCRSRRRDVYIWISIDLPTTLYPGRYVVQLTITDMNHPNLQMDQERCELVITSPPSEQAP